MGSQSGQQIRQKKKKIAFFSEIGRVKIFLSPTHPHMSNVYENIYFLFQKKHTNKKISTSKFIRTNLRFFPFKQWKIGLFVFQQKKYC